MARTSNLVFCCLLAACSQARDDAEETADARAAAAGNAGAGDALCQLFSTADVARYIGEPVTAGEADATSCQWNAADGTGDMMVNVAPAEYHEHLSASPGYRLLADLGTEGFVATFFDGWLAGAIAGDEAIRVSVAGAGASEATNIAALREAIERRR